MSQNLFRGQPAPWYFPTSEFVDRDLPLEFDRPFQVDSLIATHRRLLLRSPASGRYGGRVDLLFSGLCSLRLPVTFPSLLLRHATEVELAEVEAEAGEPPAGYRDAKVYVIEARPRFAYVRGLSVQMAEDREPDTAPSSLLFGETRQGRWPDQIVRLR